MQQGKSEYKRRYCGQGKKNTFTVTWQNKEWRNVNKEVIYRLQLARL
jgi:hypothetical protein